MNRSARTLLTLTTTLLAALALAAPSAFAAGPTGETGPTGDPAPAPKPPAKRATVQIKVSGGLSYAGRRYALKGERLVINGSVKANLGGRSMTVEVLRGRRTVARRNVTTRTSKGVSTFRMIWRAGSRGTYRVRVVVPHGSASVARAGRSVTVASVRTNIRAGNRGAAVRVFQSKLRRMAYVTPVNGVFDAATGRALLAYRKVLGMPRRPTAGAAVARKLAAGKGRFRLRHPKAGRHVEVSIRRQVMVFANSRGRVERIYHVSTGKASTPTILGTYRVYMRDPGTNSLGMVMSSYFIRGYAIHGYADVPIYPASHGCVRVPVPNAASIYSWIGMGTRVDTYL